MNKEVLNYSLTQAELIAASLVSMNDIIIAFDKNHRFIIANTTALEIFGLPLNEFVGKHWSELTLPKQTFNPMEAHLPAIFSTGKHVRSQIDFPHRDGAIHYYDYQMSPIFNRDNITVDAVISVCRDITDLIKAEKKLEQTLNTRDEILALVSHDLKNPLSAVSLNASLILRELSKGDSKPIRKSAEIIQRATAQMNHLIEDILLITKIEKGNFILEKQPVDAKELLLNTLELFEPLAAEKHISLRLVRECSASLIHADKDRIAQVFSNIIGNALKFTSEGGSIDISCQAQSETVEFSIADSGIGIQNDHIPHIFDRFWQAQHARRAGTGLGLAIAKGIIDAHGGKIWVESVPGRGSTFYFTVPLAQHQINEDKSLRTA